MTSVTTHSGLTGASQIFGYCKVKTVTSGTHSILVVLKTHPCLNFTIQFIALLCFLYLCFVVNHKMKPGHMISKGKEKMEKIMEPVSIGGHYLIENIVSEIINHCLLQRLHDVKPIKDKVKRLKKL